MRTTSGLLALFSILALLADRLPARKRRQAVATTWYAKTRPTFSDALAAMRREIWREQGLATSACKGHQTKPRLSLPEPWAHALCHAA